MQTRRVAVVLIVAVAASLSAAYALRPQRNAPPGAPAQDDMAQDIGTHVMQLLHRGHVAGRSGDIMLVPKPHNFLIGRWDLTTLGTGAPVQSTSHPNPWSYLVRVPILLYGPGHIGAPGTVYERVDLAALAPTYADILHLDAFSSPADSLPGARPKAARPPKVILTVVIDGGGWNALQRHPGSHPFFDSLQRKGVMYANATIGSAPAITGAIHATLGTGVYPVDHGIPGNQMRGPDGENIDAWLRVADPRFLRRPTVSEVWDEAHGNRPVVASVSYKPAHLGMIGHGAQRTTGDKDIAVLWEPNDNAWWTNEDYYELPAYLQATDAERLASYEDRLDDRDGLSDGTWFGHPLEELRSTRFRAGTPAFVRFTGDTVMNVLRRERIGTDGTTDLVWVEMKTPDYSGHAWNVVGNEQADVLRATDRQIARFVGWLDRVAGSGSYLVAITADHGQEPPPELSGGWRIFNQELARDIEERFGPVVEKISLVDIFLDRNRIRADGIDPDDIARFIATYTIEDNIPPGAPGADRVPEARLAEKLFAGAFSTGYLMSLTPEKISSLGAGIYPESDLTIEPGGPEG